MLLLSIGIGEMVAIALLSLVLFGVDGMVGAARTFGKYYRQVRDAFNDVRNEIESGFSDDKLKGEPGDDQKKSTAQPAG